MKRAVTPMVVLIAATLFVGCGGGAGGPGEAAYLNQDLSVEYVGQEACRQCHFEKHATYVHTGMGHAFYSMAEADPVEDWTERNEMIVQPEGLHYRMERRGDRFYQTQFLVDSRGAETALDEHELIWVIGSNNHSRSYVIEQEGKWFQAPICWYPETPRWDLCPGYEFKNDHFAREISMGCIHCHNGHMEQVEGERNAFKPPYPRGIGCERCHGPGQLHVQRWEENADTPSDGIDRTIVNPRRLPPEERIEVCYQCHLGDAKTTERVVRPGLDVADYRPGQLLSDFVVPFHYQQQTKYDFGISSQSDRLMLSRCFEESGGRIDCLTCHNPHISVYHAERPPDYFRQRCLSCHDTESCSAPGEQRQATEKVADDCVACHMRTGEPDDHLHTTFTDHWIRRDAIVDQPDHRDDYEVQPMFPERFASLPKGEQAFYRGRGRHLIARDAPEARHSEMWARSERDFQEAIDSGFDNVQSWFFLGKVRDYQGKKDEAAEAFETATRRDPTHHDAAYAWGQALAARGDWDAALEIFGQMLERDPEDAMALAESGRVLAEKREVEQALSRYEQAIEQEPWQSEFHRYRGMLLAALGRLDEATEAAGTATRLDPDESEAWAFYTKVMQAAGRPDDAREGQRMVDHLTRR